MIVKMTKKILFRNGKPILRSGKIVLSENPSNCNCCDCKYSFDKCENTGEYPELRNIAIEVDFPTDTFTFESLWEREVITTDDPVPCQNLDPNPQNDPYKNPCYSIYRRRYERYFRRFEISGMSAISGTYFSEFSGGNEELCIDPTGQLYLQSIIANGSYTYNDFSSYEENFYGDCQFPSPFGTPHTSSCSDTLPIEATVFVGGQLFTPGGQPVVNGLFFEGSYFVPTFGVSIRFTGTAPPAWTGRENTIFGNSCGIFGFGSTLPGTTIPCSYTANFAGQFFDIPKEPLYTDWYNGICNAIPYSCSMNPEVFKPNLQPLIEPDCDRILCSFNGASRDVFSTIIPFYNPRHCNNLIPEIRNNYDGYPETFCGDSGIINGVGFGCTPNVTGSYNHYFSNTGVENPNVSIFYA